jgi:hypothetical protein
MATKKVTSKKKIRVDKSVEVERATNEKMKEDQFDNNSKNPIHIAMVEDTSTKEIPLFVGAQKSAARQVEKHFNLNTLQSALKDAATNKQNLGDILINAMRAVSKTINDVAEEGNRTAKNELRLNEQYRQSVLEKTNAANLKSRRKKQKNEYVVEGQVLHPRTGAPVPGVTVEAIDKDISKDDLLGVDITDSDGRYRIQFLAKDFKESGEKDAEILLKVGLKRDKVLAVTPSVTKMGLEKTATIHLTLPESAAGAVEKNKANAHKDDSKRLLAVDQSMMTNRLEQKVLSEIGGTFGKVFDNAAVYLEKRFKKTTEKK